MIQNKTDALVAVGSNLPLGNVSAAKTVFDVLAGLSEKGQVIRAVSPLYRTPAYPAGAGPDFVNAAFALRSDHGPAALLDLLHAVENEYGRERRERWAPRTLDLDLIAYGDRVCPDAETVREWIDLPQDQQMQNAPQELLLPHPRIQDRAFVLVPLNDIAPDWIHPLTGRSVHQMLAALPQQDRDAVKRLVNPEDRP